ncbi:hypothetical protein FRC19_008215 [Serendipita sp. 401]|nr:hypothetical protein FRC19_008215 [Serendipita sp. 401]
MVLPSARQWATLALLPVLSANALLFDLSPHTNNVNKRQEQHHRLAQLAKRAAPVLPATWSYQGCYTDGAARTFTAGGFTSATMTIDKCVAYCNTNNYIYAGLEYSQVRLPYPILSPPNRLLVVLVVGMLLTRLPLGML